MQINTIEQNSTVAPRTAFSKMQLTPMVTDRLLELLSTDTNFRRLFKKNRHAALAQLCGSVTEDELRAASPLWCLAINRLASKQQIDAARMELKNHLTSNAALTIPHCFEAGKMESALYRK